MVLFHTFLSVFSLRLGAIIIGTMSLVNCLVRFCLTIWALESISEFSNILKGILGNQFILAEKLNLYENLLYYVIGISVFYGANIFVSYLLIVGAYQCKRSFIYPMLWMYIIHVPLVCVDLSLVYLILNKQYDNNLHFSVIYFTISIFVIAFYIYSWCCIFSLATVIKILQRQVLQKIKSDGLKRNIIPQVRKTQFKTK